MQIISPAQCRAARALLNWSQPELAELCDIHVQTISNFEKEASTPSKTTLDKISTVLQLHGIVFEEDDGVKRRAQCVQQYKGVEGFKHFMDDVYKTAERVGGEICLLNAKPDNWIKWLGEEWNAHHSKRMAEIRDKFTFRVTLKEKDYHFLGKNHAEYRWVPAKIWNEKSFYVYGDKIGFLNFENDEVNIFVLEQKKFAETFRFLFNLVWDQYTIIPDKGDYKPLSKI
jgi:transcriptional regulator with XRE-family HTH domain